MSIGITERGDAAVNISEWESKINTVDFTILITKNPLNPRFLAAVERNKDKVIVHATITGFGGTIVEPEVRNWEESIKALKPLHSILGIEGKVVLRVDPIVPTPKGIRVATQVITKGIEEYYVRRVRYSFLDMYAHVRERFKNAGVKDPYNGLFNAPQQMQDAFTSQLSLIEEKYQDVSFESCAEYTKHQTGCVSKKDTVLFNTICKGCPAIESRQRKMCFCSEDKKELLSYKGQCPHKCLYCYWK